MVNWQAILLIYPEINVRYGGNWFTGTKFKAELTPNEISDALAAFNEFPALARECSQGEANVDTAGEYPRRGDLSGRELERREGRHSCFGPGALGDPFGNPKQIQRHRCQQLLQMRFD